MPAYFCDATTTNKTIVNQNEGRWIVVLYQNVVGEEKQAVETSNHRSFNFQNRDG